MYTAIPRLVVATGVGSHRADVTILECAKALAALDGRPEVTVDDALAAAKLALGHRVALDPFDANAGLDERILRRVLEEIADVDLREEQEKKAAGPAAPG
jgi:magnesium chelatase subunit D